MLRFVAYHLRLRKPAKGKPAAITIYPSSAAGLPSSRPSPGAGVHAPGPNCEVTRLADEVLATTTPRPVTDDDMADLAAFDQTEVE